MTDRDDKPTGEPAPAHQENPITGSGPPILGGSTDAPQSPAVLEQAVTTSYEKGTVIMKLDTPLKGGSDFSPGKAGTDTERAILESEIEKKRRAYVRQTIIWGIMYHSSLYVSAILCLVAALALKLDSLKDWPYQKDLSAILAGAAGVIIIMTVAGGFHRKWRVARLSKRCTEELVIDFSNYSADINNIRERLKKIIRRHDERLTDPDK